MEHKTFGDLVKSYRIQRKFTQEDVAKQWGYTREYVSQVEKGKRKLTSDEQVHRLAEILEIPIESIVAVGRVPMLKAPVAQPSDGDNVLFAALLSPAQATIKLSWLVWHANNYPEIEQQLIGLIADLENALTLYHGQFVKQAQEIQAYAHEMLGKIAFDQLELQLASYHFQEMLDLGEELSHPDLITLAIVHQADILRKRNRLETSLRRFQMAEQEWVSQASPHIQGLFYQTRARAYTAYPSMPDFLRNIEKAEAIAESMVPTLDTESNEFNLVEVLQEKAQGYTILWEPEKALEIYKETDALRPYRPLRDQGSYNIVKAQAYCYAGAIDVGLKHAMEGLDMAAKQYHSKRHIKRLQGMSDRLSVTKIGQDNRMKELRKALAAATR